MLAGWLGKKNSSCKKRRVFFSFFVKKHGTTGTNTKERRVFGLERLLPSLGGDVDLDLEASCDDRSPVPTMPVEHEGVERVVSIYPLVVVASTRSKEPYNYFRFIYFSHFG